MAVAMKKTTAGTDPVQLLQQIPNVGPRIAEDLIRLGIERVEDLQSQDPTALYQRLCRMDGVRHDPCVGDVFAAAVSFANGNEPEPWWNFSRRRKTNGHY